MVTNIASKGAACLNGVASSVIDSFTIVDKFIPPITSSTIPHFGSFNMLIYSTYAYGDNLELATTCYKHTALFSAAGAFFAGYPVAAAEILVKQWVIAPTIFSWTHDKFNPDHTLDYTLVNSNTISIAPV